MTEYERGLRDAAELRLSGLMVKAGMVPLDASVKEFSRFEIHAGMNDLSFFETWLERTAKNYIGMQARHQSGEKLLDDDMFEFVLGKAGAFREVLINYRAAKDAAPQPDG